MVEAVDEKLKQFDFITMLWGTVKGAFAGLIMWFVVQDHFDESTVLSEGEQSRREQVIELEITERAQAIASQAQLNTAISTIQNNEAAQTRVLEGLQRNVNGLELRLSIKDQEQDDRLLNFSERLARNEDLLHGHMH